MKALREKLGSEALPLMAPCYCCYDYTKVLTMKNLTVSFVFINMLFLLGCGELSNSKSPIMTINDPHSFARPEICAIRHLDWKAKIHFDREIITATASFTIEPSDSASELILDTKDLKVQSVTNGNNESLNFKMGEDIAHLGSPLTIEITGATKRVVIEYQTSPAAEALQWLVPAQTADKTSPFLFTQSQAILARSWLPIQDSPGVRFTYRAEVSVPQGLLALMSAANPTTTNNSGIYQFEMKQPIPAYLMALAVGRLEFASLGPRSGVYAEPSMLQKSANEFEDLEEMISSAETLYGPYQWDRYDLIVLPPSFPFGGMENPRLTFATPTILAGDKSLTSLVAHELAHSWSGNLVTNATWDDFWLNEGFTVYFENRIMEAVYGREYSEMLALLALQDLKTEIQDLIKTGKEADTHLKLNLSGRNPDDGMTAIAYDKGYYFLRLLEERAGRARFDDFLKGYFAKNAFKVMTTEIFIDQLKRDLIEASHLDIGDDLLHAWIYGPGLPDNCPLPVSGRFENVDLALTDWLKNTSKGHLEKGFNVSHWSTHEWLRFIRQLPDTLDAQGMASLDGAFGFTASGNSEIFAAWAVHVIAKDYKPAYDRLESFLINTGRRKFLMPLYTELIKTEEGKQRAKTIYQKARPNYHYVSSSSIDALFELK